MKKITILGSTGSIGTQTLDVVRKNTADFKVSVLTCGYNTELLCKQIEEFKPELVVTGDEEGSRYIKSKYSGIKVLYGEDGIIEAATASCDMVLNALMGIRGLVPTYYAIESGNDIALANKETLVAGGELIMEAVHKKGVSLLPVDSEHSAIFQCLEGNKNRPIKKILLTASGGPFRGYTYEKLKDVTLAQALNHPKWSMGKKITVDSATMMNKGLEVIEARWLFDVEPSKIQILVHPQSILHSAVEFMDNSVIGQMGRPDMRIPISFALGYPDRISLDEAELDFFSEGAGLTFEKPDTGVFKCTKLAYEALEKGGMYPAALNGANEVLVDCFLKGKISFIHIGELLEKILNEYKPEFKPGLEGILSADREVRKYTEKLVSRI